MKSSKRARRRAELERVKAAAAKSMVVTGWGVSPYTVGRFAACPKMCGGPCCGNPRRYFKHPHLNEVRAPAVRDA